MHLHHFQTERLQRLSSRRRRRRKRIPQCHRRLSQNLTRHHLPAQKIRPPDHRRIPPHLSSSTSRPQLMILLHPQPQRLLHPLLLIPKTRLLHRLQKQPRSLSISRVMQIIQQRIQRLLLHQIRLRLVHHRCIGGQTQLQRKTGCDRSKKTIQRPQPQSMHPSRHPPQQRHVIHPLRHRRRHPRKIHDRLLLTTRQLRQSRQNPTKKLPCRLPRERHRHNRLRLHSQRQQMQIPPHQLVSLPRSRRSSNQLMAQSMHTLPPSNTPTPRQAQLSLTFPPPPSKPATLPSTPTHSPSAATPPTAP